MSHGYGSLRGVIGVCSVIVSTLLLTASSAAADSPAPAAAGTDVVVAATIRPVRIVVVDDHDRITEILSNGPGNITPGVHRGNSEGPAAALSPSIAKRYSAIMRHVDQHKTGAIYRRQATLKPSPVAKPAIISILLSGGRFAL